MKGNDLLNNALTNKGTAFSLEERTALGLHGLLPPRVQTNEAQLTRTYQAFSRKFDVLEKHIYLRALQDRNEILFYNLLLAHIDEMLPIVYTPVVAAGAREFSRIYRRPRGLFIGYEQRDSIREMLRNRVNPAVDVIVVTDGERVLGIGDQGVGGMAISIGKLALYTLIGGLHPARALPVVLDVGTNNKDLLAHPEYLGWQHERVTGQPYLDFIDQFVQAVKEELPNACLQWEDFASTHAQPILDKYRDQLLTFNDDIQGTAAVVLGAVLSAVRHSGVALRDQQIVFLGAGSASMGVAGYLRTALIEAGLSDQEASLRFWIVDKDGLLHAGRSDLNAEQRVFARPAGPAIGLAEVIASINATVLIGLSTVGGAFTESIVREMARKTERPIILPLSNPTVNSEASPEDLARWTDGRAIVATGSPFPGVSQCNNVYIFPALGLGIAASGARRVTDRMIMAAARALAANSPANGALLPHLKDLRKVAVEVACAVGIAAQESGVAPAMTADALRVRVIANQWVPAYPDFLGQKIANH